MGRSKRKSDPIEPQNLTPLLSPLQALQNLLSQFNDQGVIIGGIAASLLGTPRYTADLDAVILIRIDELPLLLDEAAKQGIVPRIADPIPFAQKSRVLLLRHEATGININLSLGVLLFEIEMVERSQMMDMGSIQLRLPTPEDLIIMKAVAHRPKDLEDIEAISTNQVHLDKERIRYWVEQFGEALELPDLWKRISERIP
jgi:predicted nucleotidyltransferase